MIEIAGSCITTDQPASIPPTHTATFQSINLLLLSRRLARSNIPARRRDVGAMEPQIAVEEPHVQNAPLPFEMYDDWARYPKINLS